MTPLFFETPADFRAWLVENHASAESLSVGFLKKHTERPSMTWPESVDEALCQGWIDGVRKRIDDESYTIRFTPRKPGSIWSVVNIERVRVLSELSLMQPSGLAAFQARTETRSGIYSHEQEDVELPEACLKLLQADATAWEFYRSQPPSYRKAVDWWVVSAKKEETRRKRMETLVECSGRLERVPRFTWRRASD